MLPRPHVGAVGGDHERQIAEHAQRPSQAPGLRPLLRRNPLQVRAIDDLGVERAARAPRRPRPRRRRSGSGHCDPGPLVVLRDAARGTAAYSSSHHDCARAEGVEARRSRRAARHLQPAGSDRTIGAASDPSAGGSPRTRCAASCRRRATPARSAPSSACSPPRPSKSGTLRHRDVDRIERHRRHRRVRRASRSAASRGSAGSARSTAPPPRPSARTRRDRQTRRCPSRCADTSENSGTLMPLWRRIMRALPPRAPAARDRRDRTRPARRAG